MKSPQNSKQSKNQQPKRYKFYLGSRQRYILINCDFESGNIQLVKQISQFQFRLASVHDGVQTGHKVNSKSWFYFCVTGFPKNTKGKFFITKVQTLSSIFHSKYNRAYRPVYKSGDNGNWQRLPTQAQLVMREQQLQCVFQYTFKDQNQKVYFAFTYPYTYSDNIRYMQSLNKYFQNSQFYFHKQILTRSIQGRDVHLLTITSHDHKDMEKINQQIFDECLFPQKNRPLRFLKPVVCVSARVHPGETASSFAMKGLLDFLLTNDLRAKLLRKMFVFMIVPMINVDGVYRGHFRMDTQGKNLNRYYIKPCSTKQPAIYAIKQLANHLTSQNRLSFYFDLHAHNAKKGHFIYGNSINDFVEQVQSQVFCKLIALNNKDFEYKNCNFTQKHMKAKDKFEDLTKQGCGRVVMHRLAKIIHSYSVQCGIVSPNFINEVPNPPNQQFCLDNAGFLTDQCQDSKLKQNKDINCNNYFTPKKYENLGKNLMVSILDVFDKNPFNRVYNSNFKSLDMLRRVTAFQIFHEDQRFRMFQRFVFGKVKNINDLIKEVLNEKLHYKKLYNFYFFDDKQLKNVEWPQNIPGLSKPKSLSPNRNRRYIPKDNQIDYTESFKRTLLGVQQSPGQEITQQELENVEQENLSKSSETQNFEEQDRQIPYEEQYTINQNSLLRKLNEQGKLLVSQFPDSCEIKLFQNNDQQGEEIGEREQLANWEVRKVQCSTDFTNRNAKQARSKSLKQDYIQKKQIQIKGIVNVEQMFQKNFGIMVPRSQVKNSILNELREQIRRKVQKQITTNKNKNYRIKLQSKIVKNFRIYSPKKMGRQKVKTEGNFQKIQFYAQKCTPVSPSLVSSQLIAKSFLSVSTIQNN